ncbi:MAG: hypothetical protein JXB46_02815 [Candidatus Eisenbacteria bacterium]|nr:hypothetical protein [Candidatus Eisenbacteria bacterium]
MLYRAALVLVMLLVLMPVHVCAEDGSMQLIMRPGSSLQSASLGYNMGALTPYAGLDIVGISGDASTKEVEIENYYDARTEYRYENESSLSGSAMLIMPHVGIRYAFGQGDVRPYVFGSVFKSFASVSAEAKETERWYEDGELVDSDESGDDLDEDTEKMLESLLGFWGLNLGVGGEYLMTERFSIGAEFGLRMVFTSTSRDGGSSYDDYWYEESESWEEEASASLRITYASIFLGFRL